MTGQRVVGLRRSHPFDNGVESLSAPATEPPTWGDVPWGVERDGWAGPAKKRIKAG
jgi:hypothetical protein